MQKLNIARSVRTASALALTIAVSIILLSACQPTVPPDTATGLAPTAQPVAIAASPTDTPAPYCYVAKQGDNLLIMISRSGYANLDVLPEVRRMNNLCDSCNSIQVGKTYCIPRPPPSPSPQAYTEAPRIIVIPNWYTPVDGDTLTTIVMKTKATLGELCLLNSPDPLNCGGCNLDGTVGNWGCTPPIKVGIPIEYYESTPTPAYPAPRLDVPPKDSTQSGPVELVWLPVGVLPPDEFYLVLVSDVTAKTTREFEATAESLPLPADMQPADNQPHTLNWRVVVSRKAADGTYIQVGQPSVIYTFTWKP